MNQGHAELKCEQCHIEAPGTFRQQVQANVAYALGRRTRPADFGYQPVGNKACMSCHDRPTDRHPVFRFLEPRFAEAREAAGVHQCTSCHGEHYGGRVQNDGQFCSNCHQTFELEEDHTEPTHAELARSKSFDTCLRCHDFHGNHLAPTPTSLEKAPSVAQVRNYLSGGPSIYGNERRHVAQGESSK